MCGSMLSLPLLPDMHIFNYVIVDGSRPPQNISFSQATVKLSKSIRQMKKGWFYSGLEDKNETNLIHRDQSEPVCFLPLTGPT